MVPASVRSRWPELVGLLRAQQESVLPELVQTLEIGAVEAFARQLRGWGEDYRSRVLLRRPVAGAGHSL